MRIWVEADPLPIMQAIEALDGSPGVTYRLDTEELEQLQANLDEAGLTDGSLSPRCSRAAAWN